ncbi:hypothetical protein BGX38DRAFT_1172536 [Terfezia claveryi]|nr:hypothetical protein BGX38DRAFT_1172536 [Terfezia claveryi]
MVFQTISHASRPFMCGHLFTILEARFLVTIFLIDPSFLNSIKGFRRSFLASSFIGSVSLVFPLHYYVPPILQ